LLLGTGTASVLASPFLPQLLASAALHDFAQPDFASLLLPQLLASAALHDLAQPDLASPSLAQAPDLASDFEQQAFAAASLLEQDFSVFDFSAAVTFCADAVDTVKAKIRANSEIKRAVFFICINLLKGF
jgi:hypothetical protein